MSMSHGPLTLDDSSSSFPSLTDEELVRTNGGVAGNDGGCIPNPFNPFPMPDPPSV